ncbi:MAG: GAF domain-containing protein, partial [Xanthobacteraceae bacterium]
ICDATFGIIYRRESGGLQVAATLNVPPAFAEARRAAPPTHNSKTLTGRMLATKAVVHIADGRTLETYTKDRDPGAVAAVELGGVRTVLAAPLLRDNELIGSFALFRQVVRPFTDKQIALLESFAAQAVIAIENARLLNELRRRTDDLSESLEQQTAAAEVLRVISASPGDLKPVFQAMLENAIRICDAKFGTMFRHDNGSFEPVAMFEAPAALVDFHRQRGSFRTTAGTGLDRALRTKDVVHIADEAAEPTPSISARLAGARSIVVVPMLKDDEVIGVISVYRDEVRPFTDKQITLVQNFAAQAVIAIENARLLSELRESLEQQTATADVLHVISSSPGELKPVFHSILNNATRICQAEFGSLFLREGEALRVAAHYGSLTKAWDDQWQVGTLLQRDPELQAFQTLSMRQPIQVADLSKAASYLARNPKAVNSVEVGGIRTMVTVPMLKDGETIGVITIFRTDVREFTDKQIGLVTNFAAQAVIAIENARLLNELRQSLEQQTATADVLGVINASRGDLQPVFEAMVEKARRLCDADSGHLALPVGDDYRSIAVSAMSSEMEAVIQSMSYAPGRGTAVGRALTERRPVQISDIGADKEHTGRLAAEKGFIRTILGVPLLRQGEAIGAFGLSRRRVEPFSARQIELVQNFAAQAVIAIENTRLLNELHRRTADLSEALDQQTATSEVLKIISTSPGELQVVFQATIDNATRLCGAKFGALSLRDGENFRSIAMHGVRPSYIEERQRDPIIRPTPGHNLERLLRTRAVVHIPDLASDVAAAQMLFERAGARALLNVPLLKGGDIIGSIMIYREEPGAFTDKQIELVTNFAAQAVIAIENARLLNELRQRTDDLSKSLDDLRMAQDRLVQTQKLAELGQLTAGIAHEIKNPLNFVNNFSALSVELIDELQEALGRVSADDKTRGEIAELADTLRGNLDKIGHHGKRADSIVKNMLQHSREGSGDRRPVNVNAVVEESLNLAYHGARAEQQGFTVTLERSFDPAAGEANIFPQEITRVLLNLIGNGFYAAAKRQAENKGHEAVLTASTKNLGDKVEIRIRDNGTGIPPGVKEKIFNPFFTTKPAGEGTGLGLSISHDIIVKQHSGAIEVDSEPGQFTEIRIVLPRAPA